MYASTDRPSIAPERLIRSLLLLQVLYSIRSERMLVEQLDYNLLFRWFVGLSTDEAVWDASTFSKNRERFTSAEVGLRLLTEVVRIAKRKGLTSDEHFSVDGTLIAAWASQKSVRRKDGNDDDNPDGVGRNLDATSTVRSGATRRTSRGRIRMPCWRVSRMRTRRDRAMPVTC
jgi:transposase